MRTTFGRWILRIVLPFIAHIIIRLLFFTCRKHYHLAAEYPSKPFIVAFWHGELLMQPFLYKKIRQRHPISVMISEHFDGEIIARIISFFGFSSIRGSSSKGGAKVLIEAIKQMRNGVDVAITPDGPRGPRHSVAEGIVALAKKTSSDIVVFSYDADRAWRLHSWDGFIIPKPFSRLTFYANTRIEPQELTNENAREYIQKVMSRAL